MTYLQEAYQILNQESLKKDSNKSFLFKPQRPEKEVTFLPFSLPKTRKVSSQKEMLSKVLAFMDMVKYFRFSDGLTVLPISCKNKRLLSMFHNTPELVSKFIKFMKNIGLIASYDESYQWNAYYNRDNHSKTYAYSYNTEILIKDYCKQHNINKYQIKNLITINSSRIQNLDSFDKESVKFSSKLNLLKPDNWTCKEFEDYLTLCLYENYPLLAHYQEIADEINETYYKEDMDRQIRFTPHFQWRKGNVCVTHIGIRATNALVAAKKEKKEGDDPQTLYREDLLKKYSLKYEFDVKSSIPRVTYLMNKGEWRSNDVDFYKEMYDSFIIKCPTEALEWNEETRKIFKSFHMRGYFDTYVMLSAHTKRAIALRGDYDKEKWNGLDRVMKAYKDSIIEVVGELEDSEIFFHESCIYLDVLKTLLERGVDVLQVYDCFYTNVDIQDIQDIITYKANTYLNKYKPNKHVTCNNTINSSRIQNRDESIENLASLALDIQDIQDIITYKANTYLNKYKPNKHVTCNNTINSSRIQNRDESIENLASLALDIQSTGGNFQDSKQGNDRCR